MPIYAILGATGSTGSSLVKYLYNRQDGVKINVYARSASKYKAQFTDVPEVKMFFGDLNADLLKSCLRNVNVIFSAVDVIFSAVAQNANEPGCSIAQQTAYHIVSALDALRKEGSKCPILVFLSSASLNPHFAEATPAGLQWVLKRGNYYVYEDLRKALDYLKAQSWIPLIMAEPPALVQDIPRGVKLSQDEVTPFLSYDDLARGMVQMAEDDPGQWIGKGVGLAATGNVKQDVWPLIKLQLAGLIGYFFPALWRLGYGQFW